MSIPEQPIIDTSERDDVLVWWTDQAECEAVEALFEGGSVEYERLAYAHYIITEFASRLGRAGRGRLWCNDQFGDVGIPWDTTKPASRLAGKRGGIVIWATDAAHVFGLPGFLTDLQLNFINELEQS